MNRRLEVADAAKGKTKIVEGLRGMRLVIQCCFQVIDRGRMLPLLLEYGADADICFGEVKFKFRD